MNKSNVVRSVKVIAMLMIGVFLAAEAKAADMYLDTSATAGLQGSASPKWTNAIWSVDLGGTNRTFIAPNDNAFIQVETGKSLGTLTFLAVPLATNYYVNDFTVGNTNIVTIGGQQIGFNIAGNLTVQEQSKLIWEGSGNFVFKPMTTTILTIKGGSTNVFNAGASAKLYTMGSLVFGEGSNRLTFSADLNLTVSDISGGSLNEIDLGANSAAGLKIDTAGACVFDGAINGAGDITKSGVGTLVLGGQNTFSGATSVSAGTLVLAGANTCDGGLTLGGGSTLIVSNSVAVQSNTLTYTSGSLLFGNGITEFTFGGLKGATGFGLTNLSGAITLKVGNNNENTSYTGLMSGPGSLVKIGDGTLYLTKANTYTGGTIIQGGALSFTNGGTYNGAISNESMLIWASLTAGQTNNGIISGGGGLVKGGTTSTLTLTATNTYSGNTIVSNGVLKTSNALSLSTNTALTVVSGALVNLNATTQTCVSVSGDGVVSNGLLTVKSALYPGGSNVVGTLTVTNLTLMEGASIYWDYGASGSDTNKVPGRANLPTNATVYVNNLGGATWPSRAVVFDCGTNVAPGGVSRWTVVGGASNARAAIVGNQVQLVTPTGSVVMLY